MGHHVEEAAPHFDYDLLQKTIFNLLFANLAANIAEYEQQRGTPAAEEELEPLTLAALERGWTLTLAQYLAAIAQLNRQVRRMTAAIGHPTEGAVWLQVNGETRQSGDLNQMIWKVPEMISYLSRLFELKAGDLIFAGTPAGVGAVVKGDEMVGHVAGVDDIRFRVA